MCLLPLCGNFRSLRRIIAMTAAALDEGRSGNLQRQSALLHHIHVVLESAAQDPTHEMQWGWPILVIQDLDGSALALSARRTECSGSPPQGAHGLGGRAQEHGSLLYDSCRDKRFGRRQHQEGSTSGARPAQSERKQV